MTCMLRDRADGQIEIVILRPEVVGVMADRDLAERFVAFLASDEDVADEPTRRDLIRAVAETGDDPVLDTSGGVITPTVQADLAPRREPAPRAVVSGWPVAPASQAQLPAVADRPKAPVMRPAAAPETLGVQARNAAFDRIASGEKLAAVAADIGTTFGVLRSLWAHECRRRQQQLAEDGAQTCECGRAFIPSVTSPDKCARCARVA